MERNLVRTIARARRDLPTKDIDVCVFLNSRVRIVQKVRRFWSHDGIIGEVSLQRNNQLVSQNVVMATLISPLHYQSLGTCTVSSQDINWYLDNSSFLIGSLDLCCQPLQVCQRWPYMEMNAVNVARHKLFVTSTKNWTKKSRFSELSVEEIQEIMSN